MANHKETVHHMVFGLTIGMLSEDETKLVRNPKPVSLKAETFSKVTYAVINATGEINQIDAVGVIMGCDQLQRNLVVKTSRGNISIRVERILEVKQYSSVKVLPGCAPNKVPSELPADAIADDDVDGVTSEDTDSTPEDEDTGALA